MRVKELVAFIKEREAIRLKKEAGKPRPWTKDLILGKYRFCNIHREDDRVTKELRQISFIDGQQWHDPDEWFWWIVARLFNNPDTMRALAGLILPWKPERVRKILHVRKAKSLKNFNAAYIVSTNGVAMDKVDYLVERVLNPLWAARKLMRPSNHTLEEYRRELMQYDGLGSFIAAQVVADLKYMEPLKSAPDWWTFAASGPGSRRGMNRVMGREVNAPQPEAVWRENLAVLSMGVHSFSRGGHVVLPIRMHNQDLQNCLCEFDKYERARLGEGTPKQIYKERSND